MAAGTTKSKSDFSRAWDRLVRLLARRDYLERELIPRLEAHVPPPLLEDILNEARARGLIPTDDAVAARLCETYEVRLKSARYIADQLSRRGLTPLPRADFDENELAKARELIMRKFGDPLSLSTDERARAFRFLNYRGFEDRFIRRVFPNAEY